MMQFHFKNIHFQIGHKHYDTAHEVHMSSYAYTSIWW